MVGCARNEAVHGDLLGKSSVEIKKSQVSSWVEIIRLRAVIAIIVVDEVTENVRLLIVFVVNDLAWGRRQIIVHEVVQGGYSFKRGVVGGIYIVDEVLYEKKVVKI